MGSTSAASLAERAYERIEELIVNCALKPGLHLTMQDLQTLVGLGRTPIHQAVSRLAADTLIAIKPRHGLQIAPIDLTRDRRLLTLRRDVERFVIELATERSGASERNQLLHLKRQIEQAGSRITIEQFNVIDRRIDQLLLQTANEPYVENTLRPLHSIFRRIGWVYHMESRRGLKLERSVAAHVTVIDAVCAGDVQQALSATDQLVDFVDSMFDVLEKEIAPSLLDVGAASIS